MSTEQLRAALREYVLLDAERTLVAEESRHSHLRGAARVAWLQRTRYQLEDLRWKLIAFALLKPQ